MTKKSADGQSRKLGLREFVLAIVLMVGVWAAQRFLGGGFLAPSSAIESEPSGGLQVLFTSPRYPDEESYHSDGLDEKLATAIDAAQQTVDIAAFEFDLERVADALVRASQRGVQVRVVVDSDYEDEVGLIILRGADIPIVTDDRDPFMHNKFVVIDSHLVWSGSWNLTDNGTYRNNNNVLIVESKNLADNYTAEFDEMFEEQAFGASSPDQTPHPQIDFNGVLVENYFESEGQVSARIVELVASAESSVYFMAFAFTDNDIAKEMVSQARAGLDVRGVMESRNANGQGSDFESMLQSGVDMLKDGNPYAMHHKVIIVDEAIVITGSYNFTASAADKNDENVLIVHSPELAAQYLAEFERVYQQAKAAQ